MYRILFVATLRLTLTLSPVLVFDGQRMPRAAKAPAQVGRRQTTARANPARAVLPTAALQTRVQVAKALPGQAVAASRQPRVRPRTRRHPMPEGTGRHQRGKGKSGQSGPSNSDFQQWCRCQRRCGASPGGQSAGRGSGSNTASSNAGSKANGSASGSEGQIRQSGSSNNGAGASGTAGASVGGQSGSSQNATSARGAAGASRSNNPPSRTAAGASTPSVAAVTTNPAGLATPSAVVPGSAVARITGWRGDRVRLPGRLRPERGTGRVIGRQAIQLAMTSTFGMFVPRPAHLWRHAERR